MLMTYGNAIMLVLAGFIVQVVDFPVDAGFMTINLCSDIVAYILILIGLKPFLKEQNLLFRKCFKLTVALLIVEIFARLSTCLDFGDSNATIANLFLAVTSLIFMQLVYNYTETIMLQSKFLKIEINPGPLRGAYSAFCVVIIAYYVINAFYSFLSLYANILLIICAIYYCGTMYTAKNKLYPPLIKKEYD